MYAPHGFLRKEGTIFMEETPKKKSFMDIMTKVLNVTIAIVLFSMVGMIFLNAILRYAFNTSWPASEELSRFLFVWVTMLGAVVAYKDNGHVGVDLVVTRLKGRTKQAFVFFTRILILLILGVLVHGAVTYFNLVSTTPSPATNLPMGVVAASLVFSSVAMFIMTIAKMIQNVKDFIKGGEEEK